MLVRKVDAIEICQKIRTQKRTYGEYHKCLFHLHTPASYDYAYLEKHHNSSEKHKDILEQMPDELHSYCEGKCWYRNTKEKMELLLGTWQEHGFESQCEFLAYIAIVWELMECHYDLVAVTDHNTIDGFDKIVLADELIFQYWKDFVRRQGYKDPAFILGIEISCADRNHVVGIFNRNDNTIQDKIRAYLERNIMGNNLGSIETSAKTIEYIDENGGISYIAHVNTSDMLSPDKQFLSGVYTKHLLGLECLKIMGVNDAEVVDYVKARLVQHVKNKSFIFVLDSDSHSIDTIKDKFFWIKGQKCSFEMLKDAFEDYNITVSLELPKKPDVFIEGIMLECNKDTFLKGENNNVVFTFSPSLNCLIGGRGSGKTTVLNIIELVLRQGFLDDSVFNALCEYNAIWLLYHYREKEYLLRFEYRERKYEQDAYVWDLRELVKKEYGFYAWNQNKGKKERCVRDILLKDCLTIFEIVHGDRKIINNEAEKKSILDKLFDRGYSVNELVKTASSDGINEYIAQIMNLGFDFDVPTFRSFFGLKKWLKDLDTTLDDRRKDVNARLKKFNSRVQGEFKIIYQQDKDVNDLIDIGILCEGLSKERIGYYKKKNLTVDGIKGFLHDVCQTHGLVKFMGLLIDRKLNRSGINILKYADEWSKDLVDLGLSELEEKDADKIVSKINNDILNKKEKYIIETFKNKYVSKIEKFSLQFNVMNKEGGKSKPVFRDIRQLSLGQKVVAMLTFVLAYSDFINDYRPLVIDQPEDNLDNQYIYKNLVKELRDIKERRQVIIATHNATIVTNAKAEQVIVMQSDGEHGWIERTGYTTQKDIKKNIINYMEGGIESFKHKMSVYNDVLQ